MTDPLILRGDYVYLRDDLSSVPIVDFVAFTKEHGKGRYVKGDKTGAPTVPGYRVFMALAPKEPPRAAPSARRRRDPGGQGSLT